MAVKERVPLRGEIAAIPHSGEFRFQMYPYLDTFIQCAD